MNATPASKIDTANTLGHFINGVEVADDNRPEPVYNPATGELTKRWSATESANPLLPDDQAPVQTSGRTVLTIDAVGDALETALAGLRDSDGDKIRGDRWDKFLAMGQKGLA